MPEPDGEAEGCSGLIEAAGEGVAAGAPEGVAAGAAEGLAAPGAWVQAAAASLKAASPP